MSFPEIPIEKVHIHKIHIMATWFFSIGGKIYGPVSEDLLKKYAQENRILPETFVKPDNDDTWIPAKQIKGLFALVALPTPPEKIPPSIAKQIEGLGRPQPIVCKSNSR